LGEYNEKPNKYRTGGEYPDLIGAKKPTQRDRLDYRDRLGGHHTDGGHRRPALQHP
jgi:hypothetical protein